MVLEGEVVDEGGDRGAVAAPGRPGKPRAREPAWVPSFLATLAEGRSVSAACGVAGIANGTAYDRRDSSPAFAAAWVEAYDKGTDAHEDEAHRRATEGTLRPVFYKGQQVGAIREFSDRLLEISLRARRPARWREQVALELSGSLQPSAEELAKAREEGKAEEVERAMALIARTPHVHAA